MPAKPWSDTLTLSEQDDLYLVYVALFRSCLPITSKQRSFEAAIDGAHSWSINHATLAALTHLCTEGSCDGLRRAHIFDRKERARVMFKVPGEPMAQGRLFEYFFLHDAVVLATKAQNKKDGQKDWGPLYAIPAGLFSIPGMKAVAREDELKWANRILTDLNIAFKPTYIPKKWRRPRAATSSASSLVTPAHSSVSNDPVMGVLKLDADSVVATYRTPS